jgi:hypothetical protein
MPDRIDDLLAAITSLWTKPLASLPDIIWGIVILIPATLFVAVQMRKRLGYEPIIPRQFLPLIIAMIQAIAPALAAVTSLYLVLGAYGVPLDPKYHSMAVLVALLALLLPRPPRSFQSQFHSGAGRLLAGPAYSRDPRRSAQLAHVLSGVANQSLLDRTARSRASCLKRQRSSGERLRRPGRSRTIITKGCALAPRTRRSQSCAHSFGPHSG